MLHVIQEGGCAYVEVNRHVLIQEFASLAGVWLSFIKESLMRLKQNPGGSWCICPGEPTCDGEAATPHLVARLTDQQALAAIAVDARQQVKWNCGAAWLLCIVLQTAACCCCAGQHASTGAWSKGNTVATGRVAARFPAALDWEQAFSAVLLAPRATRCRPCRCYVGDCTGMGQVAWRVVVEVARDVYTVGVCEPTD